MTAVEQVRLVELSEIQGTRVHLYSRRSRCTAVSNLRQQPGILVDREPLLLDVEPWREVPDVRSCAGPEIQDVNGWYGSTVRSASNEPVGDQRGETFRARREVCRLAKRQPA